MHHAVKTYDAVKLHKRTLQRQSCHQAKTKIVEICALTRAKTSWPLKVGRKRRYGITTLNYVISQKSADLIYTAAEAWIVSPRCPRCSSFAIPGDIEMCNCNIKQTSHCGIHALRIKITIFPVSFLHTRKFRSLIRFDISWNQHRKSVIAILKVCCLSVNLILVYDVNRLPHCDYACIWPTQPFV